MKRALRIALSAGLIVCAQWANALPSVSGVRMWPAPDHTMVVLDLSAPATWRLLTLTGPERVLLELDDATIPDSLSTSPPAEAGSMITGIRHWSVPEGSRVVLDLSRAVTVNAYALKPEGAYGHRLVIKLSDATPPATPETPESPVNEKPLAADVIIAIDPGHGGEDPGAIGRRYRTREKDVTLGVARELAKLVNATPGMRAVLTRDGDYYVPLGRRAMLARRANADLFISLHADSVPGRRASARGASVYALSDRGASSKLARDLAHSENAADWIGGADPENLDADVSRVLGDLTKTATMADSVRLGQDIHVSLDRFGAMHARQVGKAGFAVLKSPVPSVLVEMAFISNAAEEKKLRSPAHRRALARAIFGGVSKSVPWVVAARGVPVADTVVREHVVKRGESLPLIARHYNVHVEALRFLNGLSSGERITPGLRLRIPVAAGG